MRMGLLPPSGRQAVEILGLCCSSDHPISAGERWRQRRCFNGEIMGISWDRLMIQWGNHGDSMGKSKGFHGDRRDVICQRL